LKINEDVGYGVDELDDAVMRHYPMAYAFFARGFAELYRRDGDQTHLTNLDSALKKLKGLQIEPGAWGLPLSWKGRVNEPYLITTAFVLLALLDGYELTGNKEHLSLVEDGIDWVLHRLGKHADGLFRYSPKVDQKIYNPHAEFTGVLWRYLGFKEDDEIRREAEAALRLLDLKVNKNGLHSYEDKIGATRLDFHSSYVLEGLHYSGRHIEKPWKTLMSLIMRPNGFIWSLSTAKREARAWGYATHLYVGALIGDKEYTPRILDYVYSSLSSPEGFYYRSNDRRIFVRHQAHMFYALAKLGEL